VAWTASKKITIDHTKVGSTLTDYPLLFAGTYTYLKTTGNGGDLTSSSAYDLIFTSDASGLVTIPFERVIHVITSGLVEYHIKVASVSSSVDTDIYLFYGNASVTTDQSSAAAVWDSSFKIIQHLGDGTTLSVVDSTGVNTIINNGATAVAGAFSAGAIGGAAAFNGSTQYIDCGNNAAINITGNNITIECWYKQSSAGAFKRAISNAIGSYTGGYELNTWTVGNYNYAQYGNAGTQCYFTPNSAHASAWQYFVAMISSGTMSFYVNASSITALGSQNQGSAAIATSSSHLNIGRNPSNSSDYMAVNLDEIRISNIARAAGYITACYNNQSSPSTFYAITTNIVNSPLTLTSSDILTSLSEAVTNSGYSRVAFAKSETINNFLDGLALIGGNPDYHLLFGELVTLTDSANLAPKITQLFSDTINLLTESVARFVGIPIKAFDTQFYNWNDALALLYVAVLKQIPADSLTALLDSAIAVRRNVPILIAVNDTINNINDALRLFDTLKESFGDAFVVSDATRLRFNYLLKLSETLTGLLTSFNFKIESRPNFSDSFTLTDSATLALTANLRLTKSDALSFTDSFVKSLIGTYSQAGFLARLRRYLNDLT